MASPKNPFSLLGGSFLITGASSGIGRATAREAARLGGKTWLTGRNEAELQKTLDELTDGVHQIAVTGDQTDPSVRAGTVEAVDKLSGVVFSAGVTLVLPWKFTTEEKLAYVRRINVDAPLLLLQSLIKKRKLSEGASVIFVTSIAGHEGIPARAAYSASKGALAAAARSLAIELAAQKIRVNCVAPGYVETPMNNNAFSDDASRQNYAEYYPLGLGTPDDVAWTICFLLSPASRWLTGQEIVVDGGVSIRHGP